jgi:hypothetical protein
MKTRESLYIGNLFVYDRLLVQYSIYCLLLICMPPFLIFSAFGTPVSVAKTIDIVFWLIYHRRLFENVFVAT